MTQMVAEGKSLNEVDWKRNGIFVVFGFAYLGGFQWWLMVNKYRQWFPTMDRFAKLPFAEKLKDTAGILDAGPKATKFSNAGFMTQILVALRRASPAIFPCLTQINIVGRKGAA